MRQAIVSGIAALFGTIARSTALKVVLIAGTLAAWAAAAFGLRFPMFFITVGLILLFPVMTSFSEAGRLAASLRDLPNRSVDVHVWGQPLGMLQVQSVGAVGAGVLMYLRAGDESALLKIAQPRGARINGGIIDIDGAAYVSWKGRRLPRTDNHAVSLRLQ